MKRPAAKGPQEETTGEDQLALIAPGGGSEEANKKDEKRPQKIQQPQKKTKQKL